MSALTDKIKEEAAYKGPSKAEKQVWNQALEAACAVVEKYDTPKTAVEAPVTRFGGRRKQEEEEE